MTEMQFDLPPEVESCEMVVVYDADTGAIRHTHRCFTWRGGRHPSREELEKTALEQARREHRDLGRAEILHADPRTLSVDAVFHVDVERRELVARPVPTRGRRGAGRVNRGSPGGRTSPTGRKT